MPVINFYFDVSPVPEIIHLRKQNMRKFINDLRDWNAKMISPFIIAWKLL